MVNLAPAAPVGPNAATLSIGRSTGYERGQQKPRLVGINHVAIEVGDIDEALEWYGRIFDFALRGKGERNAFIDMGDQFINLTLVPGSAPVAIRASSAAISVSSSMSARGSSNSPRRPAR